MEEITNLIMNSSVTIVVLAYFIYRDYKFNDKLNNSLTVLNETVSLIKDLLLKEKEEREDGTK